jgi:hypothetical protein
MALPGLTGNGLNHECHELTNATNARIYSDYSLIRVIRDEVFPSKPEEPK